MDYGNKNPVYRINYETANFCNMDCKFCFADFKEVLDKQHVIDAIGFEKTSKVLKTREVQAMLYQAFRSKVAQVLLGGGDPFMRKDTPTLIQFGNSLGLKMVVDTNALILGRNNALLNEVGPQMYQVGISLDGPTAEIHDVFREKKSFDKVISLIEKSSKFQYKLKINTVVTKENIDSLPRMVDTLAGKYPKRKTVAS